MKKYIILNSLYFLCCEVVIFLTSLILYREISLLHYINISFYIGGLFIILCLLFFTVQSGFFDVVTKSFRRVFAGKDVTKQEVEEMTPLSQVITFNYSPLFITGLCVLISMLIALLLYSF